MGTPADARSDIYALGIILYEVCAGTPPFPGNNPATIMMQHMNTMPASPALINPAIPPALVTIITRCIAKDPTQRFPSVSALLAEIEQAADQIGQPVVANVPLSLNASQAEPAMDANLPTIMSSGYHSHLTPPPGITPSNALPTSLPGISGVGYAPMPGYAPISSPGIYGISPPSAALTPGRPMTPMPTVFSPGQVFSTGPSVLLSPVLPPPASPPPVHKNQAARPVDCAFGVC